MIKLNNKIENKFYIELLFKIKITNLKNQMNLETKIKNVTFNCMIEQINKIESKSSDFSLVSWHKLCDDE